MKRRAHQRHPNRESLQKKVLQFCRVEFAKTRPERDVGVTGHLCLHPYQMFNQDRDGHSHAFEEVLASQECSVERATVENTSFVGTNQRQTLGFGEERIAPGRAFAGRT